MCAFFISSVRCYIPNNCCVYHKCKLVQQYLYKSAVCNENPKALRRNSAVCRTSSVTDIYLQTPMYIQNFKEYTLLWT
jgi:uncharacterized protein YgiM (DUF1202 family)